MSDTPPTNRLVIRIKLPKQGTPPAPARSRLRNGALLLILGPVAALLIWGGISIFSSEPTPAPAPAPSTPAPVVSVAPPVEPEVQLQPDAPPTPVNEVVPAPSPGARNTIRGTIRVTVRVTIDKQGAVLAATADEPGPSRYFERLSLEAARKWTFTPASSEEQRVMLVRFYFKRSGTTARASSPP